MRSKARSIHKSRGTTIKAVSMNFQHHNFQFEILAKKQGWWLEIQAWARAIEDPTGWPTWCICPTFKEKELRSIWNRIQKSPLKADDLPTIQNHIMGLPPAQMTVALGCTEKTDLDPLFRSNRKMLFRSIRKCHKGYFFHSWEEMGCQLIWHPPPTCHPVWTKQVSCCLKKLGIQLASTSLPVPPSPPLQDQ